MCVCVCVCARVCIINHFRCQTCGAQLGCVQHMQTFFQVSDNAGLLCNSFLMCIYMNGQYSKAVFMCDSVHMKYEILNIVIETSFMLQYT